MKLLSQQKIQPDWFSKTFTGSILGLSLAFACSALITMWGLDHVPRGLAPQLGLWSIPWIWCPLFFIAYFIPRGWQAFVIFTVLNVITYSLVFWLRG